MRPGVRPEDKCICGCGKTSTPASTLEKVLVADTVVHTGGAVEGPFAGGDPGLMQNQEVTNDGQ